MSRLTIRWLLDGEDLQLPGNYAGLVAQVFRLRPPVKRTLARQFVSLVTDWDIRRAQRASAGWVSDCLIDTLADLPDPDAGPSVWVCSGALDLARALATRRREAVYWLSADDDGATARRRDHRAWRHRQPSAQVELHELTGTSMQLFASRECRLHPTSPAITQFQLLKAGASLVRALLAGRAEPVGPGDPARTRSLEGAERPGPAGTLSEARAAAGIISRMAWLRLRGVRSMVDHWSIGIAVDADLTSSPTAAAVDVPPATRFRWLEADQGRFMADPMLAYVAGGPTLFFEEFELESRRTTIKAAALAPDGSLCSPPVTALSPPHHVSFPIVFRDPAEPGALFMLPEQGARERLVLYRSPEPGSLHELRFEECASLIGDHHAIDPVLTSIEDTWYLFLTDGRDGNRDNNLFLYTSRSLRGPYQLHPQSPVKRGLRGARMAGPVIQEHGRLVRVAQDCSTRYGAGIVFFQIEELSASTYRERELGSLGPLAIGPGAMGVHTFSRLGPYLAIDRLAEVRERS